MMPLYRVGQVVGDRSGCRLAFSPLFAVATAAVLLGVATIQSEDKERAKSASSVPAKVHGRWPNDARDTLWFGDYETASRVARESGRPIFLVLNRGAVCEV